MNDQDRFMRDTPPSAAPGLDAPHADVMAGLPVFTEWHRREFENSPWPMRIFDHETFRYLAVNDAAVKFYGYTRQEFLALTAKDTRHPEEYAAFVANLRESTGYLRYRGQRRHIKKSGEVVAVEVVTQDIVFDSRLARLGMTIDVTGRLRTQELLWQRQQEFESLAENLPDLVARFDRDHRFVYVNAAVENLSGGSRYNMIGKTQRELGMPDALVTQFELSLDEAIRTGEAHTLEFNYPTPGDERLFEAYHVPERNASGQIATVLCVARDITERKREQDLQSQLAAIVRNSKDAVISKDLDGIIRTWNPAAERLFGYGAEEVIGQPITMLIPPERLEEEALILERIRSGAPVESFESVRRRKDGTRVDVSLSISPIRDAAGKVIGASKIARDISQHKQAELNVLRGAALARLLESLARAANEAVTPEAAMVACLERICQYGRWVLGRVEIFDRGLPKRAPGRSIWHLPEGGRFDEFIRVTEGHVRMESGPFIGRVLRERTAVWVEDWQKNAGYRRWSAAMSHGLRSAFAFPIIAGSDVVAIMELFSDDARPQDPHIMGAAQSIASQLARIVEREWAHQANARMAAIVESSHDVIVSRSLDGTILTWNPAAEQLFGYKAEEIVGRNMEILYPPELKAEVFRKQKMLLQGEPVQAYETLRMTKDGRRIHVSTNPSVIRDASGKMCGVSTIIRDNTARNLAEQALRESRERLQWVLDSTGIGLWLNPLPLSELNWDRRTRELFFLPFHANPTVEWFWERLHPEDREPTRRAVEAALRNRTLYTIDHRVIDPKTGDIRWIRSAGKAIYDAGGVPVRFDGINYDITREKQAETERLESAERQRDALVREVHHRIKNNLQGVAGLLRQKIRKYPAVAPSIEEAIVQLQTVAVVYGLQGTRADGLLSLADMVEAICASAEGLVGGHVERSFKRKSIRPACVAGSEAVSVAVALNELVFNALKHHSAPAGKKRAQVALVETRDAAEIRITNRGQLPKRFDFAANQEIGNGLGLVRTLLASPGATIEFSNGRSKVEVLLKLRLPLLAERRTGFSRSKENGGASGEKAPAAHPGR